MSDLTIKERKYLKDVVHRCIRKYEPLMDKLHLLTSEGKFNVNTYHGD